MPGVHVVVPELELEVGPPDALDDDDGPDPPDPPLASPPRPLESNRHARGVTPAARRNNGPHRRAVRDGEIVMLELLFPGARGPGAMRQP
jgi:hypothetical protein